ncbi:hypothetical protein FRC10_005953 [Ceratobasidium sp. 414]|nr:hypothetical protein FRC10_005953 [Ceratobasidium sp. 414]
MNDYSSLFTSGLMLLCDSAHPRSRQPTPDPAEPKANLPVGLRSFLSLDMAESLRTFATGSSPSPTTPSRAHTQKERYVLSRVPLNSANSHSSRPRVVPSPVASTSTVATPVRNAVSPASSRRRSLPQPKPAPLAELPVLPGAASSHLRSCSDSATSPIVSAFTVESAPAHTTSYSVDATPSSSTSRRHLAPITSSLKLEISSAPTTPRSRFPTTPTSSRALSMFSPLSPPATDNLVWSGEPLSPTDPWADAFASALSPTTTESALGLRFTSAALALSIVHEGENVAPASEDRPVLKHARRRERHSAPSRNPSTANSTRSSQGSVSTHHRRVQRSGALARLEGRAQRSEWMSDDEDFVSVARVKPRIPRSVRNQLAPPRTEDHGFSFIDLTDDIASLVARRDVRSLLA